MDIEKLKIANTMLQQIGEIDLELHAWEETTRPTHLGMRQHWNDGHLIPLPCKHQPKSAFAAYRDSCINALRVLRADIENQIRAL